MLLIKKLRKQAGISIRELAEKTGIPKSSLNDMENNKRVPKEQELKIIAKALGVKEGDLWRSN